MREYTQQTILPINIPITRKAAAHMQFQKD